MCAFPENRIHIAQPDVAKEELRIAVQGFWEQFSHAHKATLVNRGFVRFDAIALVDDKGDTEYECPHLFIDFHGERGPFSGNFPYLEINANQSEQLEGLKRVKMFPSKFPKPSFGTIHRDKLITVDEGTRAVFKHSRDGVTLYDAHGKYNYLKPTDVIAVDKIEGKDGKQTLLKITNIGVKTGKELLDACEDNASLKQQVESQISRELNSADTIRVLEALVVYEWQIDQNRPVV